MSSTLVVVRTGTANLASVCAALWRCGGDPLVSADAQLVAKSDRVVLPGVGAYGAAMASLQAAGLVQALMDRLRADRPTLAICLGFQLLFEESEETPGVRGLSLVRGRVARLPTGVRVPQVGWNRVEPDPRCRLVTPGFAYFANSYCARACPPGWRAAWSEYPDRFVAAIEQGATLACQFHPELSGRWGLDLLKRWLHAAAPAGAAAC